MGADKVFKFFINIFYFDICPYGNLNSFKLMVYLNVLPLSHCSYVRKLCSEENAQGKYTCVCVCVCVCVAQSVVILCTVI
jgi:hypothetical protein